MGLIGIGKRERYYYSGHFREEKYVKSHQLEHPVTIIINRLFNDHSNLLKFMVKIFKWLTLALI
jgi:hypothetical protein